MASVTFAGDISSDLHLGGIVSIVQSTSNEISIRNCVNYGTVAHDGVVNGYCDIGGIVGNFIGGTKYLQNCINYGAIRHIGSTVSLKYIGGIVGTVQCDESKEAFIENCLSAGVIELTNETNSFIGGIAGNVDGTGVSIIHCFWSNDNGINVAYGRNDSVVGVSDSSLTELNATTLNELNEYAERNGWSRWFVLHLNGGKINNLTQETLIATKYHFPDPVKVGENTFLCWCEDIYCNVKYNTTNPSGASDVYAIWDMSTLSFNYGNRSSSTRTVQFNDTIEYPEDVRREGYTFIGWDPRPERMSGADLTVVALWAEAQVISSSSIESSSSSSPNAFVEIVFGRKDMSREEIERIIKPFTDEDFFIEKIEVDGKTGETTVIIRFKDTEKAEGFVETFRRSSEFSKNIKRIVVIDGLSSFSLLHNPMLLSAILIW